MKQCIALTAIGFAGVALAQGDLPPFEEVDTNQDGEISRVEAAAIEGLDFTTADTNQDGSLDREEYMAAGGQGQGGQSPGQGQGQSPDQGQSPGQGQSPDQGQSPGQGGQQGQQPIQ